MWLHEFCLICKIICLKIYHLFFSWTNLNIEIICFKTVNIHMHVIHAFWHIKLRFRNYKTWLTSTKPVESFSHHLTGDRKKPTTFTNKALILLSMCVCVCVCICDETGLLFIFSFKKVVKCLQNIFPQNLKFMEVINSNKKWIL